MVLENRIWTRKIACDIGWPRGRLSFPNTVLVLNLLKMMPYSTRRMTRIPSLLRYRADFFCIFISMREISFPSHRQLFRCSLLRLLHQALFLYGPLYCCTQNLHWRNVLKIYRMCTHSLLQGRDFESAYVNHKYTKQERETLASFESLDYLPSHSVVYKHWIKRQPARSVNIHVPVL